MPSAPIITGDVAYGQGYTAHVLSPSRGIITFAVSKDGEEPQHVTLPRDLFDKIVRRFVGYCD